MANSFAIIFDCKLNVGKYPIHGAYLGHEIPFFRFRIQDSHHGGIVPKKDSQKNPEQPQFLFLAGGRNSF